MGSSARRQTTTPARPPAPTSRCGGLTASSRATASPPTAAPRASSPARSSSETSSPTCSPARSAAPPARRARSCAPPTPSGWTGRSSGSCSRRWTSSAWCAPLRPRTRRRLPRPHSRRRLPQRPPPSRRGRRREGRWSGRRPGRRPDVEDRAREVAGRDDGAQHPRRSGEPESLPRAATVRDRDREEVCHDASGHSSWRLGSNFSGMWYGPR
mmetsp:Transcript_2329/g.6703  ORF Transcript_2329/g.6703 Transcript_2329/m.6703 type:complete len:212 (+) Transcript_2329:825-1460(+)